MSPTFISDCISTESTQFHDLAPYSSSRLIHAAFGMQTETAEFTDALKKSIFYGKPLDTVNLKEELGDLLWYIAIAMDELGTDFNAESTKVINKLKLRYPNAFTTSDALDRNLAAERALLENQ